MAVSRVPNHVAESDFAQMLGLSVWGLRAWRRRNYGPAAVKVGRAVFYKNEDVAHFLQNLAKP